MQLGFYFDQTRCIACCTCAVACKDLNDVPAGPASWRKVTTWEKGNYPDLFVSSLSHACYHCGNPACVPACPAEAISKRGDDGVVVVDRDKCLGRDECGHPCSNECPAGNDVRGFVNLIKQGKIEEAKKLILETNPLPGVTGRVCFHPCETGCNRNQVDEPMATHALERFASEVTIQAPTQVAFQRWRAKVAVVGSGPAGLSCAYHLAKVGYQVTVFEAQPVAGGMLRIIPEYRLPEAVVKREIEFIESLGVTIKTNMRLGDNLTQSDLDKFDAVFLAIGAQKERMLGIPGIESDKVIGSLSFLREAKEGKRQLTGEKVLVLGGGNVAFDCARVAKRLGAKEVQVSCLEPADGMLADESEIREAGEEGIVIHPSRSFCRVVEKDGKVAGVECLNLRSMNFDADGRLNIDAIAGSEHILGATTVILAVGSGTDTSCLWGSVETKRGLIMTDATGATSTTKYFAGGDVASVNRRVAYAIGSGRQAALSIAAFLNNTKVEPLQKPSRVKSKLTDPSVFEKKARTAIPTLCVGERQTGFGEVEGGFTLDQAMAEADRCLDCRGMCQLVCRDKAPQYGVESNPKMQKCDLCVDRLEQDRPPVCVTSCPLRALDFGPMEELEARYGQTKEADGFARDDTREPSVVFKAKVDTKGRAVFRVDTAPCKDGVGGRGPLR